MNSPSNNPDKAMLISVAAAWLAEAGDAAPLPTTRTMRERFGLGFNDAVRAMAAAKRIISRREVPK